ncbi:hypothetical protein BCR34DRAFT_607567 [Clohesyomyces aquaticus]|uniref:Uncharacterized protein n=1 Tax=Clohesyomyces aquaticus TaxID=1231657 RepID=A0A1Y1YF87_9PLEO|nr:hypothetical protein BCR34DRAFT_607567 [Clohesyomyces aquaticus]
MRFTTLILYIAIAIIYLSSPTTAAPCNHHRAFNRLQLLPRQAIPDKTGQTGNEPAPVRPDSIPLPQPTTNATFTSSPTLTSTSTSTTTATTVPKPTTFIPGPSGNGNTNFPNQIGNQPLPLPTPFPIASPTFTLSTGAIAGISTGCGALALLFVSIGFCIYRRRRRIDVAEIPIRRSKLGSRLGFRLFGDAISPSRAGSRRGSAVSVKSDGSRSRSPTQGKKLEAGWLDKSIIGRPKPAWLENGFLSVPKPGFLKEESKRVDEDSAPWVDKETISKPRPARPRSAEPLGRMSGMGLGMGYLK